MRRRRFPWWDAAGLLWTLYWTWRMATEPRAGSEDGGLPRRLTECPKCKGPTYPARQDPSVWCPQCREWYFPDFAAWVAALPEQREAA